MPLRRGKALTNALIAADSCAPHAKDNWTILPLSLKFLSGAPTGNIVNTNVKQNHIEIICIVHFSCYCQMMTLPVHCLPLVTLEKHMQNYVVPTELNSYSLTEPSISISKKMKLEKIVKPNSKDIQCFLTGTTFIMKKKIIIIIIIIILYL